MKLHLKRLELELHGDITAATAQEAARLLGPALAEALNSARPMAATSSRLNVAAQIDATSFAQQLARQLAPQLATHLRSRAAASTPTRAAAPAVKSPPVMAQRPADGRVPETKRRT